MNVNTISKDVAGYFLDEPLTNDKIAVLEFPVKNKAKSKAKTKVMDRPDDVLTTDEIKQHHDLIQQAIKDELALWVRYKIMTRTPWTGARNILTSRFVFKWKNVDGKRVIRARHVLHGFKDSAREDTDTYAGTASRSSQRLLVSEAALHPEWTFATTDISKAFLQGMTYKEISQATGGAEKVMHFTLPKGCDVVLSSFDGFKGYSERWEVLRCHAQAPARWTPQDRSR